MVVMVVRATIEQEIPAFIVVVVSSLGPKVIWATPCKCVVQPEEAKRRFSCSGRRTRNMTLQNMSSFRLLFQTPSPPNWHKPALTQSWAQTHIPLTLSLLACIPSQQCHFIFCVRKSNHMWIPSLDGNRDCQIT